jgi:Methyltransferase domain
VSCCAPCKGFENIFDSRLAESDLRRYRRKGPRGSTRALIAAIRGANVQDASLLDIGGGVGAVTHELLAAGAARATLADASAAFADAARAEAARQGHIDRLDIRVGDFVAMAAEIPAADVVTLDRVICCYADMPALVSRSTARSRRLYGVVYPRDSWVVKLVDSAGNAWRRLTGNAFRGYIHPERDIDAAIRRGGFRRRYLARRFVWVVALYERTQSA